MSETIQNIANSELDPNEIDGLFQRTNVPNPDPADIKKLRKVLRDNPQLWRLAPDLLQHARDAVIDRANASGMLKEHMRVRALAMRDDLDWRNSGPLEQVLIDAVVVCHLQYAEIVKDFEAELTRGKTFAAREHWDKMLNSALKRLTRATESLAKVRKLGRRTPELLGDFTQPDSMVM
jgi:hypothetical protein